MTYDRQLADLHKRAPGVPDRDWLDAVGIYAARKHERHYRPIPGPAHTHDALDRLAHDAASLTLALQRCDARASAALTEAEALAGCTGLRGRLVDDLRALMAVSEVARRIVEPDVAAGAPMAPRTLLVRQLIRAIERRGLDPRDRQGRRQLIAAVELALEASGEAGADVARMVREELRDGSGDNPPKPA